MACESDVGRVVLDNTALGLRLGRIGTAGLEGGDGSELGGVGHVGAASAAGAADGMWAGGGAWGACAGVGKDEGWAGGCTSGRGLGCFVITNPRPATIAAVAIAMKSATMGHLLLRRRNGGTSSSLEGGVGMAGETAGGGPIGTTIGTTSELAGSRSGRAWARSSSSPLFLSSRLLVYRERSAGERRRV